MSNSMEISGDSITSRLLDMYEKHKRYLEKQIERSDYLGNKTQNKKSLFYSGQAEAYKNALDNIKSLFGETE